MEFEIGQSVVLSETHFGYRCGEIVGYYFPRYEVELPSGKEISVYADEMEIEV